MEYRPLGGSGMAVSAIGLGSWLTFGTSVERERARRCVDRAFDLGVNLFDTANVYGRGAAETFLGEVLAGRPRDSYLLATKAYFAMSEADQGLSAAQIAKQSEDSLRRLRVDHVDIYQCHRYDADIPLEETMTALTRLVESGRARAIGFSEWAPSQITAAIQLSGSGSFAAFTSSQPQYSILSRRPEAEVFPLCAANGIGQLAFSPLAQGVLTGKYAPAKPPPPGSRAADERANRFMDRWLVESVVDAVERLRPVAQAAGLSMAQLALAWVLRRPEVSAALVGVTSPEQLEDNVAAAGIRLDGDTLAAVDTAVGETVLR